MKKRNVSWITCPHCGKNGVTVLTDSTKENMLNSGDKAECEQCGNLGEVDSVDRVACVNWRLDDEDLKEYDGNAISDAHCAECNRPLTNFEADNGSCCCEDCENK